MSAAVATASPAFVDANPLGFVPFKTLVAALAQWETMHQAGETRPHTEVAALSVDEIALESATLLWSLLGRHGACAYFTPPAIGDYWPGQGGVYAGQVREDDGTQYHLILADEKPASRLTHARALAWASKVTADGHTDFELPTRRASALLYANLSDRFEKVWHWTSTTYVPNESFAWVCSFFSGYQGRDRKDYGGAARAVRRFKA